LHRRNGAPRRPRRRVRGAPLARARGRGLVVKAMILAAGLGTRLRPLTLDRPKPLVDVHGRPLIEYNLLLLRRYGIVDVIINLHHQGAALRDALGDGRALAAPIAYSPEDPLLDPG